MTYIISIGVIVLGTVVGLFIGGGTLGGTIDIPSYFVVLVTAGMVLIASGSVRDFFYALKIVVSKKTYSALQIAQSQAAVALVMQSLLIVSGLIVFLCIPMLFSLWNDKSTFGPVMALGLLTLLYTGELLLILLPVKAILHKKLAACKKNPTMQPAYTVAKIPCVPYLAFIVGIPVLFFLLTIGHTFVLTDYPAALRAWGVPMLLYLFFVSLLFLISGNLLGAYFRALQIGTVTVCTATPVQLVDSHRALNFVILVRIGLAIAGAVLITICTLNTLEDSSRLAYQFSIPFLLLALPFLSALLLLPIRTRIEKAINYKLYSVEK